MSGSSTQNPMAYSPYDWNQAIRHRSEYIEERLRDGSPVAGLSFPGGILLLTVRRSQRKIFEIYDRMMFAGVGNRDLTEIEQLVDEVDVPAGAELTREGARGQEFFILVDGSVRVERDGRRVNTLGPGDFLGEIALIDGKPRIATVTTEQPSVTLRSVSRSR